MTQKHKYASQVDTSVIKRVAIPSLLINVLSLALPLTILQIYDRILPNQSYGTAVLLISGAFLALTVEAFLRYVRTWLLAASAANKERETYKDIIAKLVVADTGAVSRLGSGGLHEGLRSVSLVKDYYSGGLVSGLIDLPFVVIFLGLVYYVGGNLVFIPIAVWIIAAFFVWLASSLSRSHAIAASHKDRDRSGFLIRTFNVLETAKRQAAESSLLHRFRQINAEKSIATSRAELRSSIAQETIQVASMATSVAIVLVGALVVLDGEMTTGGLAACSILSGRAVQPLSALIGLRMRLDTFQVANQAVDKLNTLPTHNFFVGSEPIEPSLKSFTVDNVQFERFGEHFKIDGRLTVGSIACIEHSSSFLRSHALCVIAGLNSFSSGDLKWNDKSLSHVAYQSFRKHCHYIPQRAVLLNGSILDNLCGFNPDVTERALSFGKALGLNNIIAELPEGLETKVGVAIEAPLSTGATRLINITSQLSQSKRVLIVDQPEKFLDAATIDAFAKVLSFIASKGALIILSTDDERFKSISNTSISIQAISTEAA